MSNYEIILISMLLIMYRYLTIREYEISFRIRLSYFLLYVIIPLYVLLYMCNK